MFILLKQLIELKIKRNIWIFILQCVVLFDGVLLLSECKIHTTNDIHQGSTLFFGRHSIIKNAVLKWHFTFLVFANFDQICRRLSSNKTNFKVQHPIFQSILPTDKRTDAWWDIFMI